MKQEMEELLQNIYKVIRTLTKNAEIWICFEGFSSIMKITIIW